MNINSVTMNSKTTAASATMVTPDTEGKKLQNQIASKQQKLNSLESDAKISAEEKAKQRQEIQEQIAELNRKLRLLRMEQQEKAEEAAKEQKEKVLVKEEISKESKKKESDEDSSVKVEKSTPESVNVSANNIHKILAADAMIQKERVKESASRQKEGMENVLEAEIKSDKLYGEDTQQKQKELTASIKEQDYLTQTESSTQNASGMNSAAKIIIRE